MRRLSRGVVVFRFYQLYFVFHRVAERGMCQVVEKANEPYYRLTFADDDGEPGCGKRLVPMFAPMRRLRLLRLRLATIAERAGQLGENAHDVVNTRVRSVDKNAIRKT